MRILSAFYDFQLSYTIFKKNFKYAVSEIFAFISTPPFVLKTNLHIRNLYGVKTFLDKLS